MNIDSKTPLGNGNVNEGADAEVSALLNTLEQTTLLLAQLIATKVDSGEVQDSRTLTLQRAQHHLRHSEAGRQNAILDALPASIASLDAQGFIISVNAAWRCYGGVGTYADSARGVGTNYLAICEGADDDGMLDGRQAAVGIRSILDGKKEYFSMEYACHSTLEQRWSQMMVTPYADGQRHGAVVMHTDVTERKKAEHRVAYLNRVYATLSGINTLIVRATNREELFRDACRIAVEVGAFKMAWIGEIDPQTQDGKVVAWHGCEPDFVEHIKLTLRTEAPESERPACRALRQSQPVICNDTLSDPSLDSLRGELLRRGYRAQGCFPLKIAGRPVAIFVLLAADAGCFDDEETRLLRELADDISFAIDHIEKQDQINYLAYYDTLTGLANRVLFLERLQEQLHEALKGGYKLAVFLIDLERFKNINDTLGRGAGDLLLQQVAEWLKQKIGDINLLARVGADVFAMILPERSEETDAALFLENALEAFPGHPFRLNDSVFRIAFKAGAAVAPDDGGDADTLFKNAEIAIKKTKASGEHYLFYTQKMGAAVVGKLAMENQLREALDKGEYVLHYQPKIDLRSGKLNSVEALIRWNDPRTGLVPPGRFIPILEETGLIYEVGRWALRQAAGDYLRWRDAGLHAVPIAVNVSPLQLRNRSFISEIRQVIGGDENAAAGLELEITENLIMEDVKNSVANLHAIREMGVTIAIDDFGTGFSSLSYLSKLPVNTLKIDRSFVIGMTVGPEGMALVSTIISLAHALKLKVVAEGVETEEQSRLLRLLGCDEMQGYLISAPLPREILEEKFLTAANHISETCLDPIHNRYQRTDAVPYRTNAGSRDPANSEKLS